MFGKKRMVDDTYVVNVLEQSCIRELSIILDNPLDVRVTCRYNRFGMVEAKKWNFEKTQKAVYQIDIQIYCENEIDPYQAKLFVESLFKSPVVTLWIGYNCTRSATPSINGEITYNYSGYYEGIYNENSSHQWTREKMG